MPVSIAAAATFLMDTAEGVGANVCKTTRIVFAWKKAPVHYKYPCLRLDNHTPTDYLAGEHPLRSYRLTVLGDQCGVDFLLVMVF